MTSPLLDALTVPERALVPRRPMLLMQALTSKLCPAEGLPVMDVADISPVSSMFDYDPDTAEVVTGLPFEPR